MHILQVGAGSGGAVVLDLLAREPAITRITLIEPDVYESHNVHRHHFSPSGVGQRKGDLAARWIRERRPELEFESLPADITDPTRHSAFARLAAGCDLGVCAVDNEPAKYAFDGLMRGAGKPWTLGEVLSGGIGGWVHRFVPGGACYGCVSSFLQRSVADAPAAPPPDYADPGGAVPEATIPASKASIEVIAALQAVVTIEMMNAVPGPGEPGEEFTSLLFTLKAVPGVFDEAYRSFRFRVLRSTTCLVCSAAASAAAGGALDVAVDEALGRLAPQ